MSDKYPFDPTMSLASNLVPGEQHVITAVNFRDYHYIIPKYAPFFAEGLTLAMRYPNGSVRPMVEGKDFYLGFQFIDASRTTNHPVYGAISFLDTATEGVLTIDYHTVGGMWTLTPQAIIEILANNLRNPRITTWEQVVNPPERFPPIDHPHDIVDFKTMRDVQESVDRVRDAILASSGGGLAAHVGNFANPHGVTKAQVGLSLVQNYGIATSVLAQAGTANNAYMTPLRVKEAIDVFAKAMVDAHVNDKNNPHNTTKTHVGLANVQNYGVASLEEAIAGAASNLYMTPVLTKAVVDVLRNAFDTHAANFDNPHKVTKDQVGLFNLQNYPVATEQQAREGTVNNAYMTPLRSTQLVSEYVYTAMRAHTERFDNPHAVDKTQVGLGSVQNFPVATEQQARAGLANNVYMTPLRSAQLVSEYVFDSVGEHANRTDNPHGVTAAQIGAYTSVAIDTILQSYAKTTDTMPNSILWNGRTEAEFMAWMGQSGTPIDAATLGGVAPDQLVGNVLANVGSSFARRFFPDDLGDQSDSSVPAKTYWVKVHEISYASMTSMESRDGLAIVTGGASGASWSTGNNAYLLRSSARASAAGAPLVEVVDLVPTAGNSDLKFGYTVDDLNKVLTVWARTHTKATNLLATEFGQTTEPLTSTDGTYILEAEPASIVYVNAVSAFAMATAAGQAASTAQQTANTANQAAGAAQQTANTATQAANSAQQTANTANQATVANAQAINAHGLMLANQATIIEEQGQAIADLDSIVQNLSSRVQALEDQMGSVTVS